MVVAVAGLAVALTPVQGQTQDVSTISIGLPPVITPALQAIPRKPTCMAPNEGARQKTAFYPARVYPAAAIQAAVSGRVSYRVEISASGRVTGVEILSASPVGVFEDSVIREARRMSYAPAIYNCRPLASSISSTVTFEIR
jgi:TonB family protein